MEEEIKKLVELAEKQVDISQKVLEKMTDMEKTMRALRVRLEDKLPS